MTTGASALTLFRSALVSALFMAIFPSVGMAQSVTAGDIIARWQARLDVLRTLSCSIQYQTLNPKGSSSNPDDEGQEWPPEDLEYSTTNEMWMDLELNRARLEVRGQRFHADLVKLVSQHEIRMFDGSSFQKFTPKEVYQAERQAKVWVELQEWGGNVGTFLDYGVTPLLYACAMLPGKDISPSVAAAKVPLDSPSLRLRGIEDGLVVLRSGNLRSRGQPTYYDLSVDMERDAAIVRYVHYRNGNPWKTFDYEYKEPHSEPWIPSGWTECRYKSDKQLTIKRSARVVSMQLNPNLEGIEFQMQAKPGTFVHSIPDRTKLYQLTPERRIPAEHAVLHMEQTNWWRIVFLAVSVAVGMAIAIAIWLRRRQLN